MALMQRMESLQEKHKELDHRLRNEETRPMPDAARIHSIKWQKLMIKDELATLEREAC